LDPAVAVVQHHSHFGFLAKWHLALLAFLKPFGVWGLLGISIIDSSSIPIPPDALVVDYVLHDHARFLLYCFMAALGSAMGSLLPYYLGRAGGELFLLKRINRQRYEQLRDRFEKQEFLAIMLPAMAPPPFPLKLFVLAAGVFEMKPVWFFSAMLAGKFVRFSVVAVVLIFFGPKILNTFSEALHYHRGLVLSACGVLLLLLGIYVIRMLFDRRSDTKFPAEEDK
jgi:membrane protein YqaA with SNARE-associated domain